MDYKATYRAAFDFHQKWMHTPETETQWEECAAEIISISNSLGNDPFVIDLLTAIYSDIEREWRRLHDRKQQNGKKVDHGA